MAVMVQFNNGNSDAEGNIFTWILVIKILGPCLSPKSEPVHHKSLRLQIQRVHLFLRQKWIPKGIQRGNIAL